MFQANIYSCPHPERRVKARGEPKAVSGRVERERESL